MDSGISSFSGRGKRSSSGAGTGDAEGDLTDSAEDDGQVPTTSIFAVVSVNVMVLCTVYRLRSTWPLECFFVLEGFARNVGAVLSGYLGRDADGRLNYTPANPHVVDKHGSQG